MVGPEGTGWLLCPSILISGQAVCITTSQHRDPGRLMVTRHGTPVTNRRCWQRPLCLGSKSFPACREVKKVTAVLGGFDSANYKSEREWATASDSTKVPISIVYRQGSVKLDGTDPLLLDAYGSYGACEDPRRVCVCVTESLSMPSMCLEYFTCWKEMKRPS